MMPTSSCRNLSTMPLSVKSFVRTCGLLNSLGGSISRSIHCTNFLKPNIVQFLRRMVLLRGKACLSIPARYVVRRHVSRCWILSHSIRQWDLISKPEDPRSVFPLFSERVALYELKCNTCRFRTSIVQNTVQPVAYPSGCPSYNFVHNVTTICLT